MFSNKYRPFGLKNRITVTFGLVFIIVILLSSLMIIFTVNAQNNIQLSNQFTSKSTELEQYFDKLEEFAENYSEGKLRLKFEPVVRNGKLEYTKPFNSGESDFRYIFHIINQKNDMDIIALNTSEYNISVKNLDEVFRDIPVSTAKRLVLEKVTLKTSKEPVRFSVMRIQKEIKGAKFEIYVLKNISQDVETLNTLIKLFLISILIGFLIIFLTSRTFSKRILKPIKNTINTAKDISTGDLNKRIVLPEIEDELFDLTKVINYMLDKINETFEKQSRFISDVSHELRTPISIMKGYAELIDRRYVKSLSEEEKLLPKNEMLSESITAIIEESKNMSNLINSLLFLSRGEESDKLLHKESIDSSDIVSQIETDFNLVNKGKISVVENENFKFIADRNLLLQSLRIIIENGMKYSDANSKIEISSTFNKKEKLGYISVKDNGVGISQEDISKIFDRFYRVDESRNKNTGGYGLGLSIFKKIIELQKQDFKIESKIGVGTKITIVIPMA